MKLLSSGDFLLRWGAATDFDAAGSVSEGSVDGVVDEGVRMLGESSVSTSVFGASGVVCAAALVEGSDGESAEAVDDESDDESGESARASPGPDSTAIPTLSAIISPANRPIPGTAPLTGISPHDNNRGGK
ncbi:hypothetical protein BHQ18_21070 [Mycolicibacterium flavescens]|uniref:Uncharacterized protein n=1 Tax=Mycolicibacterium flavescens TaxID=1776 RepID=A0A1E3RF45_MYCFV|nr:hypothetical protein BHQ18_21070 [Mycolicibacterium flavescens]